MFQFVLSSWRSGFRGRSFHAVFGIGLLLMFLAYLSGGFSPRQPQTVALDIGYSGIRFVLILLNLFWVQELIGKEIDRRTTLFALTYPISRAKYLLGRYLGIVSLALLATVTLGLALWVAVLCAGNGYDQTFSPLLRLPFWTALGGLWLQSAVVAAFALLIASLSTVSLLPLALGAGFAIAGSSIGAVREYLTRGADGDVALVKQFDPLTNAAQWLVPDLARLDWRTWPMYGLSPDATAIGWSVLLAVTYIVLMLSLASIYFARREFS